MTPGFALHPHTADIRMHVWAATLPELFQTALEALADILLPGGCHNARRLSLRRPVVLTALDATILLVDFLSQALLYSQVQKALFCRVRFRQLTETELRGTLYGIRVGEFIQDVKAVTYHEALVCRLPHRYEARLVLDV
ncbi:MAG: archease [Candidatus Kapabacteria bacterium]|nr:archease [Candidatus Kapabacteria bacterium]MCS7169419.1 archease [Candidatus Kapabacteria bacterium]MDW7996753.1 archease [Bacteroidota bacterium]MDW8225138.1 archease [Bacteroidota bacterium]